MDGDKASPSGATPKYLPSGGGVLPARTLSDRVTHWSRSPTCVVAKCSPLASLTIVGRLPHDQIGQRESWLEGGFLSMGVGGESNVFCFYTGSELCAAR